MRPFVPAVHWESDRHVDATRHFDDGHDAGQAKSMTANMARSRSARGRCHRPSAAHERDEYTKLYELPFAIENSRDQLCACLDHVLDVAGNPGLMTTELR